MTLLVYCSYPVLDQSGEPSWVAGLEAALTSHGINLFQLYKPWVPLKSQQHLFPLLCSAPHPFFVEHANLLQLPPQVLADFEDDTTQSVLTAADMPEPNNFLPIKDLFCLVRSHIVLADLSSPSFGEVFQDVFYAHLAKIPLIGLSNRFLISPIMLNRIDMLVPASKLDGLIQQLVSYSLGYVRDVTNKTGDLSTTPETIAPETPDHGNKTGPT